MATPKAAIAPNTYNLLTITRNKLEIVLADNQHNPVPYAKYQITKTDGSLITGELDDEGYALIKANGLKGSTVNFEPLHTRPETTQQPQTSDHNSFTDDQAEPINAEHDLISGQKNHFFLARNIYDQHWPNPRCPIDEPITLRFSIDGFKAGDIATITVYQLVNTNQREPIETLSHTLETGTGDITATWNALTTTFITPPDNASETETAPPENDADPYYFVFDVSISDDQSESSEALVLTKTVVIQFAFEDGTPAPDGTEVQLTTAEGDTLHGQVTDGEAIFNPVVIGPIEYFISSGNIE